MVSNTLPANRCPVCYTTDITMFVEILQVPVHCNVLWSTKNEAIRAPKGDMQLGFCENCGHIFNLAFNPQLMEYTQAYENSLHFSPRFQSYVLSLARHLIERYSLHDKDIIEIGCGKGEFLTLLCKLGDNRGVGFDPSYVPEQNDTQQLIFVQDFYSERYAHHKADLICCRHVLEHIQYPRDFMNNVHRAIEHRQETGLFFEVPNVMYTLRDLGIWDLIYEHCSYFSASSLSHLFTICDFNVCDLAEAYEGQFLGINALSVKNIAGATGDFKTHPDDMTSFVTTFADKYQSKVKEWRRNLNQITEAKQRALVWGGGSKGVTFLNTLRTQDKIAYVVDINPRKQGMYVAGTGQKIIPPEFLQAYQPDIVIVMNPIYKDEIRQFTERLGLTPEFMYV